jgi:outer membrane protein OmpA-like peptidoglycan-associated protein
MKIKKIFMSCLLLAGVLSASAQEEYPKTVYDHNPYWYVQLQGGAQYTLGEIDFSDLISPNVQVALGRQFSPVFGARLAVNAWQSKAGIESAANTYKWKWMYVAPGIDLTFNLSNLFCGFNPNRIFNFSVFGGLGANIGWDNKIDDIKAAAAALYPLTTTATGTSENTQYAWDGTKVRVFGRAGVAADFKVSDAVTLGLEVNANTLSDRYNSKKAGNWDWYFNALAGVKINLGKTYSTRTIEAPKVPEKVVERVIERVVEKPAPQVVEPTRAVAEKKEVEDTKFRRDIFYLKAGKTWIDKSEYKKVKEVADYMKEHPNCTVEITGYADRGTGNPKINNNLSQRRAQAVANMLMRNYGIKKNRIKVDYKGDTIQPFAKEIENRVAIAICD